MRHVKIITALILAILCFSLSSCGFVSYHEYTADSEAALEALIEEYIEKISSLSREQYYEENYRREFVAALIDARNELRECKSAAELEEVYSRHEAIIMAIPSDLVLMIKYITDQIKQLASEYIYREAQQKQVDWLVWYYGSLLEEISTTVEAEELLRDFKTTLGTIKTDAQLKEMELDEMKAQYSLSFGTTINYALYRSAERAELEAIEKSFREEIKKVSTPEEANECFALFGAKVSEIKTSADILSLEREEWGSIWSARLEEFASAYSLDIANDISETLGLIGNAESKQEADRLGASFILGYADRLAENAIDTLRSAAELYISSYSIPADYREQEQEKLEKIVKQACKAIEDCKNATELEEAIREGISQMSELKTNDELWKDENSAFADYMSDKYQSFALTPPERLDVAGSVEELAKIIDYYAFYQLDGESFERDTFRVKIDYSHRYSEWIIRDVYWCCELLRSAVGITGYFEEDSSQLVITLIPYELASISNTDKPVEITRYDSLIDYSSESTLTERADDYDDFPYYELYEGRYITVWNSQQLWYALEHEYIPLPVENSPAEVVLERAKEILRDIIKDGMTIEEKVFAIYSWFGDNVTYDYKYSNYMAVDVMENFPDTLVATLNSFHAEGALLENLAVCCSYAKSCLILMRLEGIEAYRVILHEYEDNAIDNLGQGDYGSHAIVALRASDGKFYYCDVEQCGAGQDLIYEKYHQLLVTAKEQAPYGNCIDRIWKDKLDWGETLPVELFWNNLEYNGKKILVGSVEEAKAIIDEYCASAQKGMQINIFTTEDLDKEIRALLNANERISYNPYQYGGLTEYMIYCKPL